MSTIKNMTERKKKKIPNSSLDFLVPIKSAITTGRGGEGEEKKKKIQKNLHNKSKYKNNTFFLESLLSDSFTSLGVTVHFTSLG